jgi:uncharacterized protein
MERLKKALYLALGIALIFWSFYQFLQSPAPEKYQDSSTLYIGATTIPIEISDTDEERSLGLSGRASLTEGTGMLFAFDAPGNPGFWMKDMRFPIDIVWIGEDWTVVSVEKNISPETFPKVFYPNRPAKFVLELNSGDAARLGIDAGQSLSRSH